MKKKQHGRIQIIRRNPDVDIQQQWTINCESCGVIDAPPFREEAIKTAREHHDEVHKTSSLK